MSIEQVPNEPVEPQAPAESDSSNGQANEPQLTPEEQAAVERYRESQKTAEEKGQGVPEGYNEDGTPKEELIGGKFKSQDDLLKAYQELEKKQSQGNTEGEGQTTPTDDSGASEGDSEPPAVPNFTDFEQEYVQNGKLSDESYTKLEGMGFNKAQVDQYIQGQTHYADSVKTQIHGIAGGEEQYSELIQWASANMDQAAIKEYNDAVDAMDVPKMQRSLEYMKLKKGDSTPNPARRIEGESGGAGMQPFADKNEWQRAQTNRLYGKDRQYTNMVDQRYLAARKKGLI